MCKDKSSYRPLQKVPYIMDTGNKTQQILKSTNKNFFILKITSSVSSEVII
jgi:hypothetical protein